MAVFMYGNVNGTYQPPNIDLFALAKEQNNQPVRFRDTEEGKDMPAVTLNISPEGLRALHGTKLPGSSDVNAMNEERRYESEHIPVESFSNRMSREYGVELENIRANNPDRKVSLADKENALLSSFKAIADEISAGYKDGTRVRFVLDNDSEDGYRRLTKEDEFKILEDEFAEVADARFGKKHQEVSEFLAKQMEDLQRIKEQRGTGSVTQYQPEKIPDGFLDRLQERAKLYVSGLNA